MINVALVSQFFPPERNAPANRVSTIASTLSTISQLEVFTPRPSYPDPTAFSDEDTERHDDELTFAVHRTPPFPAHGGLLLRAVREALMARTLLTKVDMVRSDVVWLSIPTMFFVPQALAMMSTRDTRVIVDVRDVTWRYALDAPLLRRPHQRALAAALTMVVERCLAASHAVVVTNNGAARVLEDAGVPRSRLHVLPNGIDRARFAELTDVAACDSPFQGVAARPTVSYCGLVGMNQGLSTLVQVALSMPEVDFRIAGSGPEADGIRALAKKVGATNLHMLGQIAWPQIVDLYQKSDMLFAQLRRQSSLASTAVPSKLFEYMAAGRPIVYAGSGVAADAVRASACGVVADPENPDSVVAGIRELIARRSELGRMGRAGRDYAAGFVREVVTAPAVKRIPEAAFA